MQTVIGQTELIEVTHVAGMLRTLAPSYIDSTHIDWRSIAAREISFAAGEVGKNAGAIILAEDIYMLIFNRAVDQQVRLM